MEKSLFQRTKLLVGQNSMTDISRARVIIFGVGGVGSWCAESLIRTGIVELTIVDSDIVCITNVNRQLQATVNTVGKVKTEVLKSRLLDINPNAHINAIQKIYCKDNWQEFQLQDFDFVVDAIDSLENKIHLIRTVTKLNATLFSSMGAALRIDPTSVKVSEFWDVNGCPFARRIRKVIRKGELPSKKFMCIYSEELLKNCEVETSRDTSTDFSLSDLNNSSDQNLVNHDWSRNKTLINGSLAHMTAIYGFTIAGLIIKSIIEKTKN